MRYKLFFSWTSVLITHGPFDRGGRLRPGQGSWWPRLGSSRGRPIQPISLEKKANNESSAATAITFAWKTNQDNSIRLTSLREIFPPAQFLKETLRGPSFFSRNTRYFSALR